MRYEDTVYAGIVEEIATDFQANVLHRCGINSFKWPVTIDYVGLKKF